MRRVLVVTIAVAFAACKPDFDERISVVSETRVLAVRAEPPEASPVTEVVTYTLLVAGPAGPVDAPVASFGYCVQPKLLTENGAVSAACENTNPAAVLHFADAIGAASALVPPEACFAFGPEVRDPGIRPRDPDVTGGFYQPMRAVVATPEGPRIAFGFERLHCKLANAPADAVTIFTRDYHANANPTLAPLVATIGGAAAAFDALPRNARVDLRARWRPEDAEKYVAFDPRAQAVVPRRESMRVSWYATGGTFEHDRTGRDELDTTTTSDNAWTTPDAPAATLWAVVRDARGGVGWVVQSVTLR